MLALAGLGLSAFPSLADNCTALAALQLPHTTITRAELVTAGAFTPSAGKPLGDLPPFCRVAATLTPSPDSEIRVEVWMPQTGWNERLEGTGNGGFAGNISYGPLAEGLRRGYAVANTDMGMATPPGETASIFINRPERWKDWGYRSTHEMTVMAKQVVHAYYARDARHSYFVGCSTGGEQGLMESQRYPDDYEGIVAGAAANDRTAVHVSVLWSFGVNERSYLPASARALLGAAVLRACGKDGVVADPPACRFDPASLQCEGGSQEGCLTAAEVDTVKKLYAGPANPRTGEQIYPGLPLGSEAGWDGLDPKPGTNALPPYAPIFQWVFGADWDWRSFDFDHKYTEYTQKLAGMLNATSPNIDTFRAHGHKLLIYHGWADWLAVPGNSINYYNSVVARDKAAKESVRLFMVPGMAHCGGGPGPTHFDALGAVVDWVEQGKAPDKILASHGEPGTERPLCPYPAKAESGGSEFVCSAR